MFYKNELVANKWHSYQNELSKSLINNYDIKIKSLSNHYNDKDYSIKLSNFRSEYPPNHKYFNCDRYHCHNRSYQYEKLSQKINLSYQYFQKKQPSKKSQIKEHIWYGYKNKKSINITGYYIKIEEDSGIKYIPVKSKFLLLNNIPVSFISIIPKNMENHYNICYLMYFCFDMKSYCEIIDYLLTPDKTTYISYLPTEIIKHILYFTSI